MTDTFRREAVSFALFTTLACIAVAPAFSQAPTEAQRSAIRSECRSDYEANCASVPPGGAASLQCLQQNMSKLSSSCQCAVRAVETAPAPKAETAPPPADAKPATAAKPATETTAPQSPSKPAGAAAKPSQAQLTAIRSACRSDYQKSCSGVPPGGAAALQCLERNKSKVSASCQQAVEAVAGAAGAAAAGAPATATTPAATPAGPPAALALRPMRPREEIFVLRSACAGDVRTLCGGLAPGGGRVVQCLAAKAAALSAPCKEVLSQFVTR